MTDSTNSVREKVDKILNGIESSDMSGAVDWESIEKARTALLSLITEAETKAYNTGFDTGYKKGRAYGAALNETHEGDTK